MFDNYYILALPRVFHENGHKMRKMSSLHAIAWQEIAEKLLTRPIPQNLAKWLIMKLGLIDQEFSEAIYLWKPLKMKRFVTVLELYLISWQK